MSQRTNWLPADRQASLTTAHGLQYVVRTNTSAWDIPQSVLPEHPIQAADDTHAAAKDKPAKTPVVTAPCTAAFDALSNVVKDKINIKVHERYKVYDRYTRQGTQDKGQEARVVQGLRYSVDFNLVSIMTLPCIL